MASSTRKPSTTRKARATRKPAAAPGKATTRKATTAARKATTPNAAAKALAKALGAGWAVRGSTMANKAMLQHNGRTVVWLVQGKAGNKIARRAIGLRPTPASVPAVRKAHAAMRKVWAS